MADTLYYDGNCPLCRKEITLLERLKDDRLSLQDVHTSGVVDSEAAPDKLDMLRILHLQKESGEWLKGLDANVAAWQHTRLGWLFSILRWPGIRSIADQVYNRWADRRFCKLGY
jgi:predicted DCC family thiol-disulfide oxidoreductase YuxK